MAIINTHNLVPSNYPVIKYIYHHCELQGVYIVDIDQMFNFDAKDAVTLPFSRTTLRNMPSFSKEFADEVYDTIVREYGHEPSLVAYINKC